MRYARWLFAIAGIYGILLMTPMYFGEAQLAQVSPPAITHPELFYGFIGVTLAWQLVFLLIARDPLRHRPMMVAAVVEKASYGIPALLLFYNHRAGAPVVVFGCVDLLWAVLFVAAFLLTRRETARDAFVEYVS